MKRAHRRRNAYTPAKENAPHRFAAVAFLILALGFFTQLRASVANVSISQSGNGSQSGATCADAKPASFFNNGANWGTGAAQIGPGTTVHLCNTFSSGLVAQGSGTAGNPITILWEPGAKLSAPALAGVWFILDNTHDIVLDGGGPGGTNGIIENTANGSTLGNQVQSDAIRANGSFNFEVKNLLIRNIYVHSLPSDTFVDDASINCVLVNAPGTGFISIHDNLMHDENWCLKIGTFSSPNTTVSVYRNEIYRIDHGMAYYGDGTNFKSTMVFHDNWIHDFANWDTTDNSYHHDGIHQFTGASDATFYNNKFSGSMGGNNTSFVFSEIVAGGNRGSNHDSNQLWYNNIWIQDTASPNWISNGLTFITGQAQFYNNTWICVPVVGVSEPQEGLRYNFGSSYYDSIPQHFTFENNVVTGCSTLLEPLNAIRDTLNNNAYSNHLGGGPNYWSWNTISAATLAAWQSASGGDALASYVASSGLNSSGVPQSGSSAINTAANLTTLGITTLNSDINGSARPAPPTLWTAGANNSTGAASPAMSLSPTTLTFPGQVVGTTSTSRQLTVTNVGGATLTISALPSISGTNGPDFAVSAGTTCTTGANVAPGNTCVINSTFTPGATGSRTAIITVNGNAPAVSGTLNGTGTPAGTAAVGIAPNPLNFGNQVVGTTSASMGLTVTNVGTANLVLDNPNAITVTGTEFVRVAGGCADGATLTPGSTCPLTFRFTPSALGPRIATVTVHGNVNGSSTLNGTGTGTPAVSISPSPVTFPTTVQNTTSAPVAVTITNTGNANLILNSPPLSFSGTNGADFVDAGTGNCGGGSTVAPAAHCTANITFRPSTAGPNETGILSVNSNAPAAQVTLNGSVSQPGTAAVGITPNPLTFPGTVVGATSASMGLTVRNVGTANLVLDNPNAITVTGTEFVRVPGGCANGATIAPNGTCALTFTFTPSATGIRSATVTVHGNASGSSTLNGTGTAPAAAAFTLTPTSFNFGSQRTGTIGALHNFSIASTGGSPLVMNSASFFNIAGGTNPADFPRVSPGGSDCVAGQSYPSGGPPCLISIAFMPSTAGAETATLSINANVTGPTAALSGTGIFPALTVTPASPINFGSINQGSSSAAIVVTVRNSGTDTENLSTPGVTITGDFAVSARTCTNALAIAPAGTCTVSVVFSPTAGGTRTGTLTINGDVSATVQLTGTGIATAPVILITPRPVQFPNTNVLATSPTVSATVTNTGTATETFTLFSITGAEFAPAGGSTCGGTLGAGLSCIYNMTFTPTTTGPRTGTLTITGTVGNSVALNGAGVTVSPPPATLPQMLSLTLPAGTLRCSSIFRCNPIPLSVTGKGFLSTTTITLDGAALTTACTSVVCTAAIPSPTVSLPGFGSTAHTISLR